MPTTLTPYLSFDGHTREAFAFYQQALGARIQAMMRYADMPPPTVGGCSEGPSASDRIMHACLVLPGGAMLMAGDTPPGIQYEGIKGTMLALQFDSVGEAQTAFDALGRGGQVTMPMMPTFWAKTFGMVNDRFGVSWAVNGEAVAMA